VRGYSGALACSLEEVLASDCEVLILAAMGGAIHRRNVGEVRARIIVEGANGPVDPEADEALERRGALVVPDVLASAGGVTVSYFEWVQNLQHLSWDEDRVSVELERVMKEAYERVTQIARSRKVPLRTAAYILAIGRVGKATVLRGI
ncbi:MAG TPA: glutamate dehydrogenase, partial [Myxococcaceae bacterium]|nr:glutamate dehydrogenase [Myxococcaceae bacterium]